MKMNKKILTLAGAAAIGMLALSGCASGLEKSDQNLTTAADNFEVQRKIVGVNAITDVVLFEAEGRCAITDEGGQLEVMCKYSDNEYRKHFMGLSDNVTYIVTQLESIDASEYHTRVIFKPENLIPNFDLQTSSR